MTVRVTKPAINLRSKLNEMEKVSLENFKAMDATFSGKIGIGTASPRYNVEISSSSNTFLQIASTSTNALTGLLFGDTSNAVGRVTYDHSDNSLQFFTNTTEKVRIDTSGSVGIGTDSPATMLHLENDASTSEIIRIGSSTVTHDTGIYMRTTGTAAISWGTGGALAFYGSGAGAAERMRIDSSGNVKFGATGDGYISGTAPNTYNSGYSQDNDSWSTWMNYNGYQDGASRYRDFIVGNGKQERIATFDGSSGNVGIGTSTVESTLHLQAASAGGRGATLTIDNNATSTVGNESQITFLTDAGASVAGIANARIKAISTNAGDGRADLTFTTWNGSSEGERMRIATTGQLLVGSGTSPASGEVKQTLVRAGSSYLEFQNTSANTGSTIGTSGENFIVYTNSGALGSETYTERMRIDSSGNVGIGTSDIQHDAKLDISILDETYTDAHTALRLGTRTSLGVNQAALTFAVTGQALSGTIFSNYGYDNDVPYQEEPIRPSGYISFSNGLPNTGTGRIVFGGSQIGSTTLVEHAQFNPSGNLQFADGKGIDFSALTSPATSGTATGNVLNDYEEGTWTMSINGVTGSPQVLGYYQKVGNKVSFQYYTGGSATFSAVQASWSGLPFASSNASQNYGIFFSTHNDRTTGADNGYISLNSTTGYFLTNNTTSVPSYSAGVGFFMISGSYFTDS